MTYQKLEIVRGQDIVLRGTFSPPRDITGWNLGFYMRDALGGTLVLSKTTGGGGITIADANTGIAEITILDTDTDALPPSAALAAGKKYHCEVWRTDEGAETSLARFVLILVQEVR